MNPPHPSQILATARVSSKVIWFRNILGQTFQENVLASSYTGPEAMYAADLDGDNLRDVS